MSADGARLLAVSDCGSGFTARLTYDADGRLAGVAAREIRELIATSNTAVAEGEELVMKTGESLGEIRGAIGKVNDIIVDISVSSCEQRDGIEQVNRAVEQMDRATRQNAELIEDAAAACGMLENRARSLTEAVARFRLGNG